jgi:hypothetical protein
MAGFEEVEINFSGISRHQDNSGRALSLALGLAGGLRLVAAIKQIRASVYLLLGAASRRFGGKSAMKPELAAISPQRAADEIKNRTGIQDLAALPVIRHRPAVACRNSNVQAGTGMPLCHVSAGR